MATAKAQEPSSNPSPPCAYHVFLSFRGQDTRKNFTDHLYTALIQAGIHTFRDDDEIRRGENIDMEIKKAIRESKISVIVLSKDYASSRWCLDELVLIMERSRTMGHIVIPVFYDVDPYQVKNQTGSYGVAFAKHEKCFKEKMDRVEEWRAALKEVADMEGMVLQDRYESQFIQQIVKQIGNKLNRVVLNVALYLVGIDSHIADINLWLQNGSNDVGIATIYGVGGIGKTTIAKTIYNQNFDKFEGSSFLANVRETSEQYNGFVCLQRQLLSDLLKGKINKIYDVDEGISKIKNAISRKRVFVVLDDVDQLDQFNAIIGMREWFHRGSKIIITTRYEHLLRDEKVTRVFRVNELDDNESLQLFSWHAFGQDQPVEVYMEHSESAVRLCGGLPLALQVLGSSLSGRRVDVWENAIKKLEAIPDSKIQAILKVSYDSLQDDHDKSLFLDIACFFTGMDKDYVVTVLNGCDFYSVVGIRNLIDRYLLTINEDNKLMMHQLLRDMGREVVRQESPEDPGKHSRLSRHKDAFTVLKEHTGTEKVKGLTLNLKILKEYNSNAAYAKRQYHEDSVEKPILSDQRNCSKRHCLGIFWQPVNRGSVDSFDVANLKTNAFAKLCKLKLLQPSYVKVHGEFGDFPKSLVWLFWRGFPLKTIPNDFHLEKLVVLDMRNSSLINMCQGTRLLIKLKILNLSHSHGLAKTPDFTGLPFLERLKLKDCINLVEVDESIGCLQRLVLLNLKDCKNLKKLPGTIGLLASLQKLILSGCSKLDQLPKELQKMESLRVLYADRTAINQLHSMSAPSSSAFWSWFLPRKAPQSITFSLALLPWSLVNLSLEDCNLSDDTCPNDLSCLRSLEKLDLRKNPFHSLPDSIKNLTTLQYLRLDKCTSLQLLPELPTSLEELSAEGCTSLEKMTNLPNFLKALWAELLGCHQLVEVQHLFKLEPLIDIDNEEILNGLGLSNMVIWGNIEMIILNTIANKEKLMTPQVLHECGISSSFLPGSEVPSGFGHRSTGSAISFKATSLPGGEICGLNLCMVYARDDAVRLLPTGEHYARINNETKGINWVYSPTFYGVPEEDEDMLWFSHWRFGDLLETGDQITVSVRMPSGYYVKECGIRILYNHQDKDSLSTTKEIIQRTSLRYQNITDVDLWPYQVGKEVYHLHHHPYSTPEEIETLNPFPTYEEY